jgi:hypothetical protein
MNSDRALPAVGHGTATSRLQLAEDVVERGCRHLDIIAGAKERLLDAAGLAAEIRPRNVVCFVKADMVISVVQYN